MKYSNKSISNDYFEQMEINWQAFLTKKVMLRNKNQMYDLFYINNNTTFAFNIIIIFILIIVDKIIIRTSYQRCKEEVLNIYFVIW